MIISDIVGGLGNQMFQYAVARSLSLEHGVSLRLNTDAFRYVRQHQGYLLPTLFDLEIVEASTADLAAVLGPQWWILPRRLIRDRRFAIFRGRRFHEHDFQASPALERKRLGVPGYLQGWWQSEVFFEQHKEIIANDFRFQLPMDDRSAAVAKDMRTCNSVAVHVRRGDYVSTPEAAASYEVCKPEYYRRALAQIAATSAVDKVYFFSDDIAWVESSIRVDYPHEFVTHNIGQHSYRDMQLMAHCKSHVIANSSFSWWGAWLAEAWGHSNGTVVAPARWGLKPPSPVEVVPERWIKI